MRHSIVLKARVSDMEQAENAIFDLTESLGTFFVQEDVYFNVPNGNLKLRIMHPNVGLVSFSHSIRRSTSVCFVTAKSLA